MRKRNRRGRRKNSNMFGTGSSLIFLIVAGVCTVLTYTSISNRCTAQNQRIVQSEAELASLDRECARQSTRWREMVAPERLKRALLRHGLDMDLPGEERIVRVNAAGQPYPNQYSVTRLKQRRAAGEFAKR